MQRDTELDGTAPRSVRHAQGNDAVETGRLDGDDDFVVPEPDGVQSGVPFETADASAVHSGSSARTGSSDKSGRGVQQAKGDSRGSGLSLRLKLFLSLGLLTFLILVLGLTAFVSLRSVSLKGIADLREEARLAYRTEILSTSLHRLYEAERDLAQGDVSALRHLQRRLEAVKQDLLALETQASASTSASKAVAAGHAEMADLVGSYESKIDTYSVAVAAFREQDATRQAERSALADALEERVQPALDAMVALSASHWRRGVADSSGANPGGDSVGLGLSLNELERDLTQIAADVDRFFDTGAAGLAAAAEAALSEVLAQLEILRGEAGWRGLRDGLSQIREQLLAYAALLHEAAQKTADDRAEQAVMQEQLENQARALVTTAEEALDHVETLAANAWQEIEVDSDALEALGARARWVVGITAGIGFAIGLLVLLTVPRPIVRSIDRLLKSAREIAGGNLTTPVRSESRDELGQLAETFENMRQSLVALVQRIQRASVQLSSSINEIQAATTEQASSASEQASAANELSASLNQMSQSASTLLTSAESVGGSVTGMATTLNESDQSSSRILSSMDAIGLSTEQTAERIKALNDKMDDINEAVATISMVADQTTLLSLNASIEANKAGEMGKGFSVVASEIRRLSDRSIDSAGNINGMVRDIQRATESSALAMDKSSEEIRHGVTLVRESTEALASINQAMERILEQMETILENVRAQAESSRMVQTTAGEMLSSANMVSKAAGQTRAVSYELNAMATQLASAVSVFRV
jgi:methyl-accepting chemotaxis protein WspA